MVGGNSRTPFEGLTLSTFDKTQRPNQTYPIFVNTSDGSFAGVGKSLQDLINEGTYTGSKEDFEYDYSIAPKGTVAVWPVTSKGKQCVWRQIASRLIRDWEKGYIKISENKNTASLNQYSVQYLPSGVIKKIEKGELEVTGKEENVPTLRFGDNQTVGGQVPTMWNEKQFFTVNGTQELKQIFPESPKIFEYPKPVELISSIIKIATTEGDIVLDSFAGSGTTGHAVLSLEEKRNFILIEMMDYADTITSERIRRVIRGYGAERQVIKGTGGSFSYYELGAELLKEGHLNEAVSVDKIREYICFTETKNAPVVKEDEPYYLRTHVGTAYYFYYEREKLTTLNREFLHMVKTKADGYVVYADLCTLSERELEKYHIKFRKIPRDIKRL